MRNNRILKAMAVVAPIMLSTSSIAETVNPIFIFETVADVTITPQQLVDFGDTIIPIAGNVCTLTPDITTAAATIATTTFGATTIAGTGCNDLATDGEAGQFDITGAAGASVTITLTDSDAAVTDYDFSPVGTFMDGTGTTTINPGISSAVVLSTAGEGALVLGGDLTINVDLAYGTEFNTTTYQIDITY